MVRGSRIIHCGGACNGIVGIPGRCLLLRRIIHSFPVHIVVDIGVVVVASKRFLFSKKKKKQKKVLLLPGANQHPLDSPVTGSKPSSSVKQPPETTPKSKGARKRKLTCCWDSFPPFPPTSFCLWDSLSYLPPYSKLPKFFC
jgi:hypothetical protein